ncbi:MAG: hypothetical protein CM15mP120_11090 [Pseudomonadota bacterium]|nr:MAG: hypothetical protein CM15mP120_11090 [Pseudomonadota bacterium]
MLKISLALLGPGSGLGMATLIPQPHNQWRVLASEVAMGPSARQFPRSGTLVGVGSTASACVLGDGPQRAGFGKSISRHQWYLGQCG